MMSKTGRNKTLLPKYKWVWSLCLGLFATLVMGGIIRNTKADSISFPNLTYDQSEVMTVITTIDKFDSAPRNHGNAAMHQGHLAIIFSGGGENIDGGFAFYDMTDPYNPVLVKQLDNEQTQDIREAHGYGFSHHNNGQYVALQAANGIQIWDWTDIQNPTRLSYLVLPGIEASDYALGAWWLFWQAPYIYVGGSSNGIYIIDATDPANPILVDRGAQPNPIPTSQTGGFRIGPVFAIGNLLVATTMSGTGYATFDISEPTNPTLLTTNSGAGYPPNYSTMVNGNKIYIAGSNDHFHIMDITDPTQIIEQGSVATGDKGGYVTIQDGFAHAGVSNHYVKIDVQDPNNPTIVGTASSGITGRDEDFATVLGNLVIIGDDHSKGSFVVPHQAAPDTIGPVVNMVNPADGATNQATTTRIGLTFSDVVDLRTVDNTTVVIRPLNGSPLTGQYSGQTGIVNFHPDTPLQPDTTYQIEILAGGVKDVVGNTVGTTFTAQFST
ncbi:MAG: hypothetical protein GY943_04130, partial [Chloroflexi bacterium]|nr:hypothetical protein [Chloroflexota bacterium]